LEGNRGMKYETHFNDPPNDTWNGILGLVFKTFSAPEAEQSIE
jgi:hypothetical protein